MPLLTKDELGGLPLAETLLKWSKMDRVNEIYDSVSHLSGHQFTSAILEKFGILYSVKGLENMDDLGTGPFIAIGNHPYGSIDGLILIDLFGPRFPDFKVMVNGFLMRIKALGSSFIPVIPRGRTDMDPSVNVPGVKTVIHHIREGHPMGFFPAGAISDSHGLGPWRTVCDRPWQEPVIRLIKKMKVPVIPIKFHDTNSRLFYALGHLDWRIRVAKLPSELLNKKDTSVRVTVGPVISMEEQEKLPDIGMYGSFLRDSCYLLEP